MSGGTTYCVSGFGKGLDMRPMNFKDTVQKIRVCSLCNVIPNTVVLLPCSHSLCELCFDKCPEDGERCLLDQERLRQECVEKLTLSERKTLPHGRWPAGTTPLRLHSSPVQRISLLDSLRERTATVPTRSAALAATNYVASQRRGGTPSKSGCTALLTEDGPGDVLLTSAAVHRSMTWEKAIGEMKDAVREK
uniref:Putative secreted protein n=1 Tax=Ixodes ricinus TaxID=34613 RepID=A0A090XEA3_IXORI